MSRLSGQYVTGKEIGTNEFTFLPIVCCLGLLGILALGVLVWSE